MNILSYFFRLRNKVASWWYTTTDVTKIVTFLFQSGHYWHFNLQGRIGLVISSFFYELKLQFSCSKTNIRDLKFIFPISTNLITYKYQNITNDIYIIKSDLMLVTQAHEHIHETTSDAHATRAWYSVDHPYFQLTSISFFTREVT